MALAVLAASNAAVRGAGRQDAAVAPPEPEVELPPLEAGAALIVETVDERLELPPAAFGTLALEDGRLVVDSRRFALRDVLFVGFPWQPAVPHAAATGGKGGASLRVVLRGGDEVVGAPLEPPDEDALGLETRLGTLRIPLDAAHGAVVEDRTTFAPDPQGDAIRREHLRERLRREEPEEDRLDLGEGGTMTGIIESVGPNGVRFSTDALRDIVVAYSKIRGIALAAIGDVPPAPDVAANVRLTTRDDSTVTGRLSSLEGGRVVVQHEQLGELAVRLTGVRELAVLGGRVRYLSELEPVRTDERIELLFKPEWGSFRRDRNVLGGPLRMAGKRYRKGLGVRAYSLLEFDLGGDATRFEATIGLDDAAAPVQSVNADQQAAVIFRVRVDGTQRLEKHLSWRDPPADIAVDVAGAQRLELEVDYGSGAGMLRIARDWANWAEARLIRRATEETGKP